VRRYNRCVDMWAVLCVRHPANVTAAAAVWHNQADLAPIKLTVHQLQKPKGQFYSTIDAEDIVEGT
jgi:hypothetical protein